MDTYDCLACGAHFSEDQQTRHEYKHGICPCCGCDDIKPVYDQDIQIELADLRAMREASSIKG